MKKLTFGLVILAAGLILSSSAFGQKKNAIKLNIFSPIIKTFNIAYERAINDGLSVNIGGFYTGVKQDDITNTGFGIQPDLRIYPGKNENLKGFYIAPFVRYMNFTSKEEILEVLETQTTVIGGGLLIGGQFVFGDLVTLDLFIGPQYLSASTKIKQGSSTVEPILEGFLVRSGVTVGITF